MEAKQGDVCNSRPIDLVDFLHEIETKLDPQMQDSESYYNTILDICLKRFSAQASSIYLEEPGGEKINMIAGKGYHANIVGQAEYNKEEGITGNVWALGEPFKSDSNDALKQSEWYSEDKKGKYDDEQWGPNNPNKCWSLIAVPLKIGNRSIGVLKVENKEPEGTAFSNEEFEFLQTIASVVSLAVKNASLVKNSQYLILEAIEKTIQNISGKESHNQKPVYEWVIDLCKKIFNAGASSFYLQSGDGRNITMVAGHGYSENLIEKAIYFPNEGITGYVWSKRKLVRPEVEKVNGKYVIKHSSHEGKYDDIQWTEEQGCWSLLAVPLRIGKKLLFSVTAEAHSDLENGTVPQDLVNSFQENGVLLSDEAKLSIRQSDVEWQITDGNMEYTIEKEEEKLNIYDKNNEKAIGVLKVENKLPEPSSFTDEELRLLERIANIIALIVPESSASDLFGNNFCDKLLEICEGIEKSKIMVPNGYEPFRIIKEFANILQFARRQSIDKVYELIKQFNIDFSDSIELPKDFMNIFQKIQDLERALHHIPKYRDHLIHQTQVFLLGFCILAQMVQVLKGNIKKDCDAKWVHEIAAVQSKLGLSDGTWIEKWYLTSAFHDIGYPFEKMQPWLDSFFGDLLKIDASSPQKHCIPFTFNWGAIFSNGNHLANFNLLADRIATVLGATHDQKVEIIREMAKYMTVSPDHALMSAMIYLELKGSRYDDLDIALAICLHNRRIAEIMVGTRKLNFKEIPLACLLTFCDMAQEWGRVEINNDMLGPRTTFGNVIFDSLECNDGIQLNLRYSSIFTASKRRLWDDNIFREILHPIEQCWNAEDRFRIIYKDSKLVKIGNLTI